MAILKKRGRDIITFIVELECARHEYNFYFALTRERNRVIVHV